MLKAEKIADNLHRISVGKPDSNIYVLDGETVIDSSTGMHKEMIAKGFEKLGFNVKNVKRVINTNAHIEHVGGNSLFPNAKTFIHKRAFELWKFNDYLETHAIMYPIKVSQLKADVLLEHNHSINLGNKVLKVLQSPDNQEGHICIFDEKTGLLFSSDTEKEFLHALNLPIKKVLPAHGEVYEP